MAFDCAVSLNQEAIHSAVSGCNVLVIDPTVDHYLSLVAGVIPNIEVFVLNTQQNSVQQITQILSQHSEVSSLHLVAHGAPGRLFLGDTELSLETLQNYAQDWQQWAAALADDAEVLIYGCEVGRGDRGTHFIHQLSELTGAKIAASSTQVGNPLLGGNWELDITTGTSTTPLAFTSKAIEQYTVLLSIDPVQYNLNTLGIGTFPTALTDVNGTLYFVVLVPGNGSNRPELWKLDPSTGNPTRIEFPADSVISSISNLTHVNGSLYFSLTESTSGNELWRIDPTTGNPIRLEIVEGAGGSNPSNLTPINGTLYFVATHPTSGNELWSIDPNTGNPVRLEIEAGTGSSNPANFSQVNGTLYFTATDSSNGTELWRIDPTTGNPIRLEIEAGTGSSNPSSLVEVNGTFYFSATDSANGTELWKLDPATDSLTRIEIEEGTGSSNPRGLTNVDGTLYFIATNSANGSELWKLDPATNNPTRIEIEPGASGSNSGGPINVNGTPYLAATTSASGYELWRIDPTTGNPVLLEIEAGTGASSPRELTNVNGTLYFTAFNSGNGQELWKIDPSTGNPVRIELEPGNRGSGPANLKNINGTLYFTATTSASGLELWKIDPATGNSVLLEINPGPEGSWRPSPIGVNGSVYFTGSNQANGYELWKLDPSTNQLSVIDLNPRDFDSSPNNLVNINGILYFAAFAGGRRQLWKLDLATGNATQITIATLGISPEPSNLVNVNGTLYFTARDINGTELWKIDPSTGNPVQLEIEPGIRSSNPYSLINVNGTLYFGASNNANGKELWKVDPITGSPVRIEILEGIDGSNPSNLIDVNGTLYFNATDSPNGPDSLWKIDPATGNPVRIEVPEGIGQPQVFSAPTTIDGILYFAVYGIDDLSIGYKYELWRLDPAVGDPVRLETETDRANFTLVNLPTTLTNVNGTLYFAASTTGSQLELWKIDPTTDQLVLVDIEVGEGSSNLSNLTHVNGTLYFTADTIAHGLELWKIDPTTGNPVLLEIEAGTTGANPASLTNVNGTLYFTATNNTHGTELWTIDPATGTPIRLEIEAGAGSSAPSNLTNINGVLYFSAANSSRGRELWRINPDNGSPELVADLNPGQGSSDPIIRGFENGKLFLAANNGLNGIELWEVDVANAPTVSGIGKVGDEDTAIAFTLSDFTTAFNDVDGDNLNKIQITALPTNGVLKLNGTNVTLNQEIAAADLNNLTFVPTAHFAGTASFGWNGSDGTAYAAAPSTVTLTINNVNDPPVDFGFLYAITAVFENTPGAIFGEVVGVFDIDEGETFTYSAGDDRFEFAGNQLKLKDGVSLDTEALGEGIIIVPITITDAGGLSISAHLRLLVFNVEDGPDTVPPEAPQINIVATDDIITQAEKAAGVLISGTAQIGSSLQITWGNVTFETFADDMGNWVDSFGFFNIPDDGNTTISVTATDAAGNVSAVSTRSVLVDAAPPPRPAIALTTDSNIPTDNYTNVADLTVTGVLENHTVQYSINNGEWLSSYTAPTTDGRYIVDVRQLKPNGNASNTSSVIFYLDTTAADPTFDPVTSDNVINAAEAVAEVTLSGQTEISAQISLTISGSPVVRDVVVFGSDNAATWQYILTPAEITSLGQGNQSITLETVDLAGNIANPVTHTFTIDTIAPSATVNAISSLSADSRIAGDFITNQANQTVTGTFTGTLTTGESIQVSANGGATWNTATINGNTWSAANVLLQAGSRNLLTRTIDTAGNAIAGASRAYVLDRNISTLPALTSYSNPIGTNRFILNGIAEPGSAVTVRKGTTALGTVLTTSNGRWSLNTPNLTNGRFNLTARSVDVAGNTATSSVTTVVAGNAGNNRLAGGNGNQILVGYNGNDRLNGGNGSDTLLGGSGRDVLTGGGGGDRFNLTGARTTGVDTLSDFNRIEDRILVSRSEFGLTQTIGSLLDASLFRLGTRASTNSQRFIYDRGTGSLFFDVDGSGVRTQVKIASLSNEAVLSNRQIELIA